MEETSERAVGGETVSCSKCGHSNPARQKSCGSCGAHLYVTCKECGARNSRARGRCSQCGQRLHRSLWRRIEKRVFKRGRRLTLVQLILLAVAVFGVYKVIIKIVEFEPPPPP